MIASVWVHVGCLPQIHKQSCQQQEGMVNTKVCKVNTCTLSVCTTSHGNASRTCVRHHCMVVCVCLYLYDCTCMMGWQCAHDVMMTNTRSYTVSSSVSSNMIAFVPIHVGWDTWWGSGRFRCRYLVKVLEVSAADTCCGSGRFRCRHLVSFWRVPVQIPVEVPGPGSFTIVQHHCMLVCVWLYLYDCMCMIVWQCAHDVIAKVTWLLELVTAYSPTWLPMYEFTCLVTTMQGLMVAFSSLKSGSSLFLIPQLAAGDVPFWSGAVKKWNKAETSKLLG